jgi:hypothetical protein
MSPLAWRSTGRAALAGFLVVMTAGAPVGAQEIEGADWDVVRDDRAKSILAFAAFDVGLGVSARCADGGYDVVIGGLPPAGDRETRPLELTFRDDETAWRLEWNVAVDDTMAVSPLPAMMAREMREGGRLQIRVPDGGGAGRALRYDLELPASSSAIDATLTACGKPLVDPRDAELRSLDDGGLPTGVVWRQRPRIAYPMGSTTYARGFAVVSCIAGPDGRARDCEVETEHPRDGGFGDAVIDGMRAARLGPAEGEGDTPVRRFVFRTNFVMDGYATREDRERDLRVRERERQEREAARRN